MPCFVRAPDLPASFPTPLASGCRAYNWHSVPQQLDSVAKLRGMDFLRVLPGHGRRTSFRDGEEREAALAGLLEAEGWRPQQRAKVAAP